jgi:prenyltransferase beta subunit
MKRALPVGGLWLLLVVSPLPAQSDALKKATVAYLQKLQADDGGFRPDAGAKQSDLPSVNGALRALKYFGGEPRDRSACIDFVKRCFDKENGGFGMRPGDRAAYRPTAVGIMAVAELKMPLELYAEPVIKYLDENSRTFEEIRLTAASFEALGRRSPRADAWLEQIARLHHPDGTYGKDDSVARDTGGAVCAVLRLGGKVEHPENVLKALNAGQRKDGGFGKPGVETSDPETTYRVMRAFHMLKTQPEGADRVRAFIARHRNDDGGYGVAPGQPSSVSGTYYAGIILHWLDEK